MRTIITKASRTERENDEERNEAEVAKANKRKRENEKRKRCRELTGLVESHDVIFEAGSSSGDHDTSLQVFPEVLAKL